MAWPASRWRTSPTSAPASGRASACAPGSIGGHFRQLQSFIEYKARALGIEVVYLDPAYTSQTCADCGGLGSRVKHRFVCDACGLQAHADLNGSRNLAWIGGTAVPPRAAVNTPDVEN